MQDLPIKVRSVRTRQEDTSLGCPARSIGTCSPKSFVFSSGNVAGIEGVQIGPGATPFTRIFLSASCKERERVKLTMAPLVLL